MEASWCLFGGLIILHESSFVMHCYFSCVACSADTCDVRMSVRGSELFETLASVGETCAERAGMSSEWVFELLVDHRSVSSGPHTALTCIRVSLGAQRFSITTITYKRKITVDILTRII